MTQCFIIIFTQIVTWEHVLIFGQIQFNQFKREVDGLKILGNRNSIHLLIIIFPLKWL